jgi:hypothetical protein
VAEVSVFFSGLLAIRVTFAFFHMPEEKSQVNDNSKKNKSSRTFGRNIKSG